MPLDDYTSAEIDQMIAERMRYDWQHTSSILAYIVEANRSKKSGRRYTPDDFNPMEGTKGSESQGFKLNSVDGFKALQQLAQCQPKR